MSVRSPYIKKSITSPQLRFIGIATANAAAITSLYWNQALAKEIARDFPADGACLSAIPGITLVGYGVGVAAIAFGPSHGGRLELGLHMGLLAVGLTLSATAQSAITLAIASFLVGCGAAVAQRLLAAAAQSGSEAAAGTAIGRVICAALIGVLGVRLAGEAAAKTFGWRSILLAAAGCVATAGLTNYCGRITSAVRQSSTAKTPPWALLVCVYSPILRKAALQQGGIFMAYSAAWMLLLMHVPIRERLPTIICAGGVGLTAALLAGRLVDAFRESDLANIGALAVLVATGLLLPIAYCLVGLHRTLLLVPGMALLDGGLQVALVANQARVQALAPLSRGRLAALLTICGSLGGALGTGLTYSLWLQFGLSQAVAFLAFSGLLGSGCSLYFRGRAKKLASATARDTRLVAIIHPSTVEERSPRFADIESPFLCKRS